MKVWPIDPLVAGYFSLEVSEKLIITALPPRKILLRVPH